VLEELREDDFSVGAPIARLARMRDFPRQPEINEKRRAMEKAAVKDDGDPPTETTIIKKH
jgi:hypothetical protein